MSDDTTAPWPQRRLSDLADGRRDRAAQQRVVVVDDHALLAESVVMTLRANGLDARTVDHSSADLVGTLLACEPDLVLLDLFLDDGFDRSLAAIAGITAAERVVVVVTATNDALLHARCIEAGAAGVVSKSAPIEHLIEAVVRGLAGEEIMTRQRRRELSEALLSSRQRAGRTSPLDSLTPRERETLQALMQGHSAGRIARDKGVSLVTVRTHIRAVLLKLDAHSQLEAVARAASEGWFRDDETMALSAPR